MMGREDREGDDSNKPRSQGIPENKCSQSQGAMLLSETETHSKAGLSRNLAVRLCPVQATGRDGQRGCNCVHLNKAPYFVLHKGCLWTSNTRGSNAA